MPLEESGQPSIAFCRLLTVPPLPLQVSARWAADAALATGRTTPLLELVAAAAGS
jgi:hypothetical protein